MVENYQYRKDIDRAINIINALDNALSSKYNIGDGNLLEYIERELGKYYDSSEVDAATEKLNNDLTELYGSLDDLTESLVDFNEELIDFDKDNNNLIN